MDDTNGILKLGSQVSLYKKSENVSLGELIEITGVSHELLLCGAKKSSVSLFPFSRGNVNVPKPVICVDIILMRIVMIR